VPLVLGFIFLNRRLGEYYTSVPALYGIFVKVEKTKKPLFSRKTTAFTVA
jgi:hypothetical protein